MTNKPATALLILALLSPAEKLRGEEKPLPQSWDYTTAMKKVAAKFHGNPGVVLHVGGLRPPVRARCLIVAAHDCVCSPHDFCLPHFLPARCARSRRGPAGRFRRVHCGVFVDAQQDRPLALCAESGDSSVKICFRTLLRAGFMRHCEMRRDASDMVR